jgi:hypothetical protein
MKQGSIRKPAGWLVIVGLAVAGALSLFAFSSGGSAYAASIDDPQNLSSTVFNAEDDDCDDNDGPWGGPGGGNNNNNDDDECDDDDNHHGDNCDRDDNWWRHNAPGRSRDRDCRDRDRDDCDRDRDRRDRDHRDRDCDRDRDDDDCDDDKHDRDRRDRHDRDDDCDASITIIKQITGNADGGASFGGDLGSFSLGDGRSRSFNVDPGTYNVWETNTTNLQSIRCSGDGFVTVDTPNGRVRIRVSEGDHVTCTFTNEGEAPVKVVSPVVAPQPQIIYVPVPAPQPVVRPVEPAPAPRPAPAPVAALPRTGEGLGFQQEGNLALPLGVLAALSVAGFGYVAARRVRDTD